MANAASAPKKVVLAYSGGLDTSIILKWLQTEFGCEVVTFTADLGQGVPETGHDARRRIRQRAVEIEDHQLRAVADEWDHPTIVADGLRDRRPPVAHYCS